MQSTIWKGTWEGGRQTTTKKDEKCSKAGESHTKQEQFSIVTWPGGRHLQKPPRKRWKIQQNRRNAHKARTIFDSNMKRWSTSENSPRVVQCNLFEGLYVICTGSSSQKRSQPTLPKWTTWNAVRMRSATPPFPVWYRTRPITGSLVRFANVTVVTMLTHFKPQLCLPQSPSQRQTTWQNVCSFCEHICKQKSIPENKNVLYSSQSVPSCVILSEYYCRHSSCNWFSGWYVFEMGDWPKNSCKNWPDTER